MPIAPDVYKKIVMAKLYMDENFHESIDLDRISREACLSRYHFHRLFTRIYQRTPHQGATGSGSSITERSEGYPRLPCHL
ncbi:MAG: hypothetical protein BGO55_17000 [Sphingobacteriales bacterium 50-39]|nr:helix-turn-helix transcriptional regulator [Sphingobacteriales bacterium]OJW60172.1 MAG: hypothetical protein BGO55_17000 [Sphingobacteriales bacterium 50-39]